MQSTQKMIAALKYAEERFQDAKMWACAETMKQAYSSIPQDQSKEKEIIEVIQVDLYRDGGSKKYQDKYGRIYIWPAITAFRKESGIYSGFPESGGIKIPAILKVIKKLNGIQNGWWKEDHYVPCHPAISPHTRR